MYRTIIIAEAGVNHNGDLALAKRLIDVASEAQVDYVKFQTFSASKLVSSNAEKANYQKANTSIDENQLEMIRKLELSKEDHFELLKYCKTKNIKFLSTAFDLESIDLLLDLGIKLGKIPSGEITNYPYLVKMAKSFEKIILSTGMSEINEINDTLAVLLKNGRSLNDITILHCNTEYPTPMKDVNLLAMASMQKQFGIDVGYSDHTLGIEVPIAAVALGAAVIEKHFTLDKMLEGPDHRASIDPIELKAMVEAIRNIEVALGSSEKTVSESEIKNISAARKSIVAKTNIKKGEIFTEENITTKRPSNGISPMQWKKIIGKIAIKNFNEDDLIEI
jgi:N,N'-diacetyllegionaminate synthase